jgi:hypothetical protein
LAEKCKSTSEVDSAMFFDYLQFVLNEEKDFKNTLIKACEEVIGSFVFIVKYKNKLAVIKNSSGSLYFAVLNDGSLVFSSLQRDLEESYYLKKEEIKNVDKGIHIIDTEKINVLESFSFKENERVLKTNWYDNYRTNLYFDYSDNFGFNSKKTYKNDYDYCDNCSKEFKKEKLNIYKNDKGVSYNFCQKCLYAKEDFFKGKKFKLVKKQESKKKEEIKKEYLNKEKCCVCNTPKENFLNLVDFQETENGDLICTNCIDTYNLENCEYCGKVLNFENEPVFNKDSQQILLCKDCIKDNINDIMTKREYYDYLLKTEIKK